jgi:hypothetical protein
MGRGRVSGRGGDAYAIELRHLAPAMVLGKHEQLLLASDGFQDQAKVDEKPDPGRESVQVFT